jgi:class 3 adenylate cyclase
VTEGRKIAAILVADIVGYSRLMGAEEEATLARLRALSSELFNPTIEAHGGRLVNRAGDGAVVEFRSVVEAVRCALDITRGLAERNAPLPPERRIEIRTGIHLGDVIETQDGDLFGDAVNIAARLEGICAPGGIRLSEDAWRQVRDRLPETFVDLGEHQLKNIVRPMRVYALGGTDVPQPEGPTAIEAPPRTGEVARAVPAALAGVLMSVARLTNAYRTDSPDRAAKQPHAHGRTGIEKAVGILETIERIVDVVSDRPPGRDAGAAEPPALPPAAGAESVGPENTPRRRGDRESRGRDAEKGES